ncbi:hypothetical protein GCM10010080_30570 [Thermomonas carbonis]|nr:hypothetical protein GCM10010080_30570 [Thermomonas carbonis]
MQECTSNLAPVFFVAPELPRRLHNEFPGQVEISLTILATGLVELPEITSATWHPIGRSRGKPSGYDESIVSALSKWRYPSRRTACRHTFPIEFEWRG